jgi:hypothetical protein
MRVLLALAWVSMVLPTLRNAQARAWHPLEAASARESYEMGTYFYDPTRAIRTRILPYRMISMSAGEQFAFIRQDSNDVFIADAHSLNASFLRPALNLTGGNLREDYSPWELAWSLDSRQLAFEVGFFDAGELYVWDGRSTRKIAEGLFGGLAWHEDGTLTFMELYTATVYVWDGETTSVLSHENINRVGYQYDR